MQAMQDVYLMSASCSTTAAVPVEFPVAVEVTSAAGCFDSVAVVVVRTALFSPS